MSVAAVARKDFRDGIRSRLLWGLMGLFVLILGGFTWVTTSGASSDGGGSLAIVGVLGLSSVFVVLFLVPLTGLLVSVKSIVRERELGSLKIMLSLPHDRSEVIVGKFLGRTGLLVSAILAGFVPAAIVVQLRVGDLPLFEYAAFVLVTILFGVVFVAVGLSVSAMTSSETQATVGGVAAFFLLYFWNNILGFVNDELGLLSGDAWLFVKRFNLLTVFIDALMAILSVRHEEIPNTSFVVFGQAFSQDPGSLEAISQPIYLQHWFAFLILGIWIAVPVAIGYFRFSRADL